MSSLNIHDDIEWCRVWIADEPVTRCLPRPIAEVARDSYQENDYPEVRLETGPNPYSLPHGDELHRCTDGAPECVAGARALGEQRRRAAQKLHGGSQCPEGCEATVHQKPSHNILDDSRSME